METRHICYRFDFADGRQELFEVRLNPLSLELLSENPGVLPSWTRLDVHRCSNCPLESSEHRYCPAALSIVPVVTGCGDIVSFEHVAISVTTAERTVFKKTTAQRGISSLMGLLMAVSGCPHTSFLKPMARFHLPFATGEETMFRVASTYLLGEYFSHRPWRPVDMDMDGLRECYEAINVVNKAMAARLREAIKKDSTINALILLDLFAMDMPAAIEESLEKISYLFNAGRGGGGLMIEGRAED